MSSKANYTPFLESFGWTKKWLKDRRFIIRVDDLKKLTNGVVVGLLENSAKVLQMREKLMTCYYK